MFKNIEKNPNYEQVLDIHPDELSQKLNQPESKKLLQVVDVRNPDEYTGELGHIQDAELIVLQTIPENLSRFKKDKEIVLVCRSGGRSAQAASYLRQNGFEKLYNMRGGMLAWNQMQLPTEK